MSTENELEGWCSPPEGPQEAEPDPSDHLCWDGELGWIDPEDILGSLGISIDETTEHYLFRRGGDPIIQIQKGNESGVIRACVEEAEMRHKTWP